MMLFLNCFNHQLGYGITDLEMYLLAVGRGTGLSRKLLSIQPEVAGRCRGSFTEWGNTRGETHFDKRTSLVLDLLALKFL